MDAALELVGSHERYLPAVLTNLFSMMRRKARTSANVVVEARAAGLPVITSAHNGACELIEENENGAVIEDPADVDAVVKAIGFWWSRRFRASHTTEHELSLERNVAETLAVLELAAKERAS